MYILSEKSIYIKFNFRILLYALVVFFILYVARFYILSTLGNFLIKENNPTCQSVCFILSGNAYDRGNKALDLYNKKQVTHFYCTGEIISNDLKALGFKKPECEVQKEYLIQIGIPDSIITLIPKGTSSFEEISLINEYCKNNHLDNVILVSTKFHTRRIRLSIKKTKTTIHYNILGANSSIYKESEWWKSEY